MESILTSIKKLLGIAEEYTHFDADIIMHINTVFTLHLSQIGVGVSEGFVISDELAEWTDFLPDDTRLLEAVKTYTWLRVRLLFDPPASSVHIETINRQIAELEWRIMQIAETINFDE